MSPDARMAAVLDIAQRVGVNVLVGEVPDDRALYEWSWNRSTDTKEHAGYAAVGPKVVYVPSLDGINDNGDDAPPWGVLLHEVGHAYCGTNDEEIVSGWTDAAARSMGLQELRLMRKYDEVVVCWSPKRRRNAAIRGRFLNADGTLKEPK